MAVNATWIFFIRRRFSNFKGHSNKVYLPDILRQLLYLDFDLQPNCPKTDVAITCIEMKKPSFLWHNIWEESQSEQM